MSAFPAVANGPNFVRYVKRSQRTPWPIPRLHGMRLAGHYRGRGEFA